MKKSLLVSLLIMSMIMSIMTGIVGDASTFMSGDYKCKVKEDGTVEITKYFGDELAVHIPKKIDGYAVSSIGDSAFAHNKTMQNLIIPDTVTKIGKRAFASCKNLLSVNLGEAVQIIENKAFYNCYFIDLVAIPESVIKIGKYAFAYDSNNESYSEFLIIGYSGTVAQEYAKNNKLKFRSVGKSKRAIKFIQKSIKLRIGKKKVICVKVVGVNKVSFKASDEQTIKIVKKDIDNVVIKGLRKGKAVITAKAAGKTAKCKVTVR